MEHDGNPRCITCRISITDVVELSDGESTTRLMKSELINFGEAAIDASTLVTFGIFENHMRKEPKATKESNAARTPGDAP